MGKYLTLFVVPRVEAKLDWDVPLCKVRESEEAGNLDRLLQHSKRHGSDKPAVFV